MLGDIVGDCGVRAVEQQVAEVRKRWRPHLIIANAENAAGGSGLTPTLYKRLCAAGIDGITLGDHALRKAQIVNTLKTEANIIRPANLPEQVVGHRWMKLNAGSNRPGVYVLTVLGRLFMDKLPTADPFLCVDEILKQLPRDAIVVVEAHAEVTSEKQAIAWHVNGRAALVAGTHTHVATADARILPVDVPGMATFDRPTRGGGTAYITDLGMCGPHTSVIGRRVDQVLRRMITAMPTPMDPANEDPRICGVFVEIDEQSRLATAIERIELHADLGP